MEWSLQCKFPFPWRRQNRNKSRVHSGVEALQTMIQAAQPRQRDRSSAEPDGARIRVVFSQRQVDPGIVKGIDIGRKHSAQMVIVENDQVVRAFSRGRADDSFDICIPHGERGAIVISAIPAHVVRQVGVVFAAARERRRWPAIHNRWLAAPDLMDNSKELLRYSSWK